jgi:hypothetical protein
MNVQELVEGGISLGTQLEDEQVRFSEFVGDWNVYRLAVYRFRRLIRALRLWIRIWGHLIRAWTRTI